MRKLSFLLLTAALVSLFASCSRNNGELQPTSTDTTTVTAVDTAKVPAMTATVTEDFESTSKADYTTVSVKLASGEWYFVNALLGKTTADRKIGASAVRLANNGKITSSFEKANGVGMIQVKYAVYGTDGSSSWELWISKDNGSNWTKVDSTINATSTVLKTASFTVHTTAKVRFEIRKTSTDANHINIDDFKVSDYSVPADTTKTPTTPATPNTPAVDNDNMMLGNPSNATADIANVNNYWMVKTQYTLSYNSTKRTPNWTSWHLNTSDFGSATRQDDYRADVTLPSGWYQVETSGYSGSGFDRGHMCPSADRLSSNENNSATFLMTNMVPQAPKNNQVTWENLESYSRSLVNTNGSELYIISGPYGQGGTGSNGFANTTVAGVVVPAQVWKIIVVLPNGDNDLSRITTSTRVIAVLMPNNQTVSDQAWGYYRVSVDAIEALTGYDFLSNVPTSIQTVIEAKVDNL